MPNVYLLHFEQRISANHTAQHYLGFTETLEDRITQHRAGNGSRLCAVAKARGIDFRVARTWEGTRQLERELKKRKSSPRLCPICNPKVSKKLNQQLNREAKGNATV